MSIKVTVTSADPRHSAADMVAVGVTAGSLRKGLSRDFLKAIGSSANKTVKRADFTGKTGQVLRVATGGSVKADSVVFVGLGDAVSLTYAGFRAAIAAAARAANGARCTSLAVAIPDDTGIENIEACAAEGAVLGGYRYEAFKTEEHRAKYPLERVTLLTGSKVNAGLRDMVDGGRRLAEAVCRARDLINCPPNELYPAALADYAKAVAKEHKADGLSCVVWGDKKLKDEGMLLLSAVGQGSVRGPRFIHMTYRPPGVKGELKKLCFVGKGLTFDTGGICIKPAPGMEDMKGDMGGAANIVALMAALAVTQPNVEVHGLIASAENMPDGNSYRPGDVFGSYEGKTVEIINTDAEGRLALADALAYGVKLEPEFMLCNATLTGACMVALGPTVSGYYATDDALAEKMRAAAKTAGESMWHMPLVESLREMLKSDWADLKHMGDRWGGSITAALFLREFVGDTPWVHVDIAGPSMSTKNYGIYTKGGTGHGVLTYLALIDDLIAADD